MSDKLLSRDEFREAVFARDKYKCVMCGAPAVDAHHIIERRLFSDGGYYINNGSSLCESHHLDAEKTVISCEQIRAAAGITILVLPPHFYKDVEYDKWGNIIQPDGTRLKGELFHDESVQKILTAGGVLGKFSDRVKYPRTYHLPWSHSISKDDRILEDLSGLLEGDVVVTEKMDGENTTFYYDYLHARSLNYNPHASRGYVKAIHAQVCNDIPPGWRVCGENMYAAHSIHYNNLAGYFLVFSIWNEQNICLSWEETVEWATLLGLPTVKVLYQGPFCEATIRALYPEPRSENSEGYVVRTGKGFAYKDFRKYVGKYVRQGHLATSHNWSRSQILPNTICDPSKK